MKIILEVGEGGENNLYFNYFVITQLHIQDILFPGSLHAGILNWIQRDDVCLHGGKKKEIFTGLNVRKEVELYYFFIFFPYFESNFWLL